jgi:cell division protein FtsB
MSNDIQNNYTTPDQGQRRPNETARRRNKQPSGAQVMFAAILAIGLILAINFSTRIASSRPLEAFYHNVETEIQYLKYEQATLIAEHQYVQGDAYVEMWARGDGKMVRPGEILVVPLPAGPRLQAVVTPTPLAQIETSPPGPPIWALWWALFFDSPPPEI